MVAAAGLTEQGLTRNLIDSRNLTWPQNICGEPHKLVEGALLKMAGELIDHAAGVISAAELKGAKQALKIVPADLRIELA